MCGLTDAKSLELFFSSFFFRRTSESWRSPGKLKLCVSKEVLWAAPVDELWIHLIAFDHPSPHVRTSLSLTLPFFAEMLTTSSLPSPSPLSLHFHRGHPHPPSRTPIPPSFHHQHCIKPSLTTQKIQCKKTRQQQQRAEARASAAVQTTPSPKQQQQQLRSSKTTSRGAYSPPSPKITASGRASSSKAVPGSTTAGDRTKRLPVDRTHSLGSEPHVKAGVT